MESDTLNIRAYRIVDLNGKVRYVSKDKDLRCVISFSLVIKEMATVVKNAVKRFNYDNRNYYVQASIDLRPYHDIEHANGLIPLRCFPLTEEEADEFWKHYNS